MNDNFIAHRRECDGMEQSVSIHLEEVSAICSAFTKKIGLPGAGKLLGLLHDLGKYSHAFQTYIKSSSGILNQDVDDEYINFKCLKGKIDHSTAGAQWAWHKFCAYGPQGQLVGQILAVCLSSHHGGMLDCLRPDGTNGFLKRIQKQDDKTHLKECLAVADNVVLKELNNIPVKPFLRDACAQIRKIVCTDKIESKIVEQFRIGFLTRFLFSCLIDADRINSADFEIPANRELRTFVPVDWQVAIERLESHLIRFPIRNKVDVIRKAISEQCKQKADGPQGIYTLTVPTGGGKTFSSIRYALHHAKKFDLERIIYIIPFTSIIEQNAAAIRDVLEEEGDPFSWVLEHHSSLEPETQTWQSKLMAENWDAPIIFTTMVQFLEALFGGGTRGARRMHNIANSVLIFDEIQTLPIHCVHIFCNAIQFFVDNARTTAVLCTATQPLLNDLRFSENGQLVLSEGHELVGDTTSLFADLERVKIRNDFRAEGWSEREIVGLALEQLEDKGNCLVVVNTKDWARRLYQACSTQVGQEKIFHLSTNLCPDHRKQILNTVRMRLENGLPTLCISTQLIEAGVDVDFNSVIRFLAGLDSIAQAAGRCNRNGHRSTADVFVINLSEEAIEALQGIKVGREKALRIFSEYDNENLLSPATLTRYFSYYFHERASLMTYPLSDKQAGRKDSLLSLLSDNRLNIGQTRPLQLRQSFKTAGVVFKAIDAPTHSVIVPYGEGKSIIAGLCGVFEHAKNYELLKNAQKFSVNIFPNVWRKLKEADAVIPVREGAEIYYLDERYYSNEFGLSTEQVSYFEAQVI